MLKEKALQARSLQEQYIRAYETDFEEGRRLELEYLDLKREVLLSVDDNIKRQKSLPIHVIKKRVAEMPKRPKRETGIRSLDMELVTEAQKMRGERGGLSLGNYIQIAGSRGAGKSSFMLKILTSLSNYEPVCWIDFEMGEKRVVEKLKDFDHSDDNLLYYNSSRYLDEIIAEIKFLNASGVNHFVIDSTMKIMVKGVADKYDRFSLISQMLSELTSTLMVNIYIINQMSQSAERDGVLSIKHGNDAEYDADYIFYVLKMKKEVNGEIVKDELGFEMYDEDMRVIKCTKNREDDRTFTAVINKSEIFGIKPIEITYEG